MGTVNLAIGIDLGQRRDPTAVCVAQLEEAPDGRVLYTVRYLERLPLMTPYPEVARRLTELIRNVRQIAWEHVVATQPCPWHPPEVQVAVFADATGVGRPLVDALQEAADIDVTPVIFTHGMRRTVERDQIVMGKGWLVSRLQTLLQGRRLRLPQGHPEARALFDELVNYEIRVSRDGDATFGAFKTGTHDDLATALGLAVQEDALTGSWDELDAYYDRILRGAHR